MSISIFIADSEGINTKKLLKLIQNVPELMLLGTSCEFEDTIEKVDRLSPDVLFLSLRLKNSNGFDILEKISPSKSPLVVFLTNRREFTFDAFSYCAFDYLLKPIESARFLKTVAALLKFCPENNTRQNPKNGAAIEKRALDDLRVQLIPVFEKRLPLKMNKGQVMMVDIDQIKYIVSSGSYSQIITTDKKHLSRCSLTDIMYRLSSKQFIRIHRSTILNINYILEFERSNFGEVDVTTIDNNTFRVGHKYKSNFLVMMEF